MEIKTVKRPWQKAGNWKNRKADTIFYQSSGWRKTRASFLSSDPVISLPPIGAMPYKNIFCVDCWADGKINSDRIEVDHDIRKEDGGTEDFTNLRSRCHRHHSQKSARESNKKDNNKDR